MRVLYMYYAVLKFNNSKSYFILVCDTKASSRFAFCSWWCLSEFHSQRKDWPVLGRKSAYSSFACLRKLSCCRSLCSMRRTCRWIIPNQLSRLFPVFYPIFSSVSWIAVSVLRYLSELICFCTMPRFQWALLKWGDLSYPQALNLHLCGSGTLRLHPWHLHCRINLNLLYFRFRGSNCRPWTWLPASKSNWGSRMTFAKRVLVRRFRRLPRSKFFPTRLLSI